MFYRLESERLLLRKITIDDKNDIFEYGVDEQVNQYVLWPKYSTVDDAVTYINFIKKRYEQEDFNVWGIELKAEKKLIGAIDFVGLSNRHRRGEIGYVLNRAYWNKGYMSEAAKLVLGHAFNTLNLNKVCAKSKLSNTGSYRVMEKIGMEREGILREHFMKDDVYYSVYEYSILKKDYTPSCD